MDATALGTLLLGAGTLITGLVAYLGKRAETAAAQVSGTHARISAELDQVQEERDGLLARVESLLTRIQERDDRVTELLQARLEDQVEMARLRVRIIEQGGEP